MRAGTLLSLLLLVSGCDPSTPEEMRGEIGPQAVLLQTPGISLLGRSLEVRGEDGEEVLARAKLEDGGRSRVPLTAVEIRNLPDRWKTVVLADEPDGPLVLLEREKPVEPPSIPELGLGWGWFVLLYGLLGLIVVALIGVSGGPCHGEQPFMWNLFHVIAFLWIRPQWASPAFLHYSLCLGAATVLTIYSLSLPLADDLVKTMAVRLVTAALYVLMCLIVCSEPEYASDARWSGHDCIQVYAQKSKRAEVVFGIEEGKVLATDNLDAELDLWVLYLWTEADGPSEVRIGEEMLSLGERPPPQSAAEEED